MRKNIEKIIGLTLCVGMLTGCAKTPESSLVKPKGSSAMDAYKEADDSVDMVENNTASDEAAADSNSAASENDNTTDSNNSSSAASAAKTTIRDLINAPQTYKSQVTDDSAKLVINTDATVGIPDVDKISAISVTPAEVTQDLLDRITDAFFSNATLYTADSYYIQTKSEIKEILDGLKEDVANGNLDPITGEQMMTEIISTIFMRILNTGNQNMKQPRKPQNWRKADQWLELRILLLTDRL